MKDSGAQCLNLKQNLNTLSKTIYNKTLNHFENIIFSGLGTCYKSSLTLCCSKLLITIFREGKAKSNKQTKFNNNDNFCNS